jgi:hypothetical protein
MGGEELRELEASLSGAGRVCKHLRNVSLVCSIVFLVACVLLLILMVVDAIAKGFDAHKFKGMLYVVLYGTVILWLLFVAYRSFSDVVDGESPFTIKQVVRFRNAALLLLALAAVDALLSTGFVYGFCAGGIDFAALGNFGTDQNQIRINAMVVFFAIILLGIASLFRYGVLLQRLADETD